MKSDDAPECGLTAEHYFLGPDQARQIWLRAKTDREHPVLLTRYDRDADLVFSPDCGMIAMNDNLGSDVSEVRLFTKVEGVVYKADTANVTSLAWAALERVSGLTHPLRLGHTYVNAITWSDSSKAVLLRVWGHTDERNQVSAWYCVYDRSTGRVSTNLSLMNRGAVIVNGRAR